MERAADEITSASGNRPQTIVADVMTKDGRDAILPPAPIPTFSSTMPPGDFCKFERDDWIKALDGNMLAPIALIKATIYGMIARKRLPSRM